MFFRLDTDPPLHIALGRGDMAITVPSVDPAGTIYLGGGRLLNVPDVEALINGITSQAVFSLGGVQQEFVDMIDNGPSPKGKTVVLGIAPLDTRFQPLTQIIGLWTGAADFWTATTEPQLDPTKPFAHTISLSVTSGDPRRARALMTTFTDTVQRAISPTDAFFDRISRYVQNYLVAWPRF